MSLDADMHTAVALHQRGDFAGAERAYANILVAAPGFADALHLRGVALSQLGRHEAAIALLQKAVAQMAGSAAVHHNLAKALHAAGQLDAAEHSFKDALQRQPEFADAWGNLGNLYKQLKRRAPAIDCYQRSLRLRPGWFMALNNLGNVLCDNKQAEKALPLLQQAVALKPDSADAHSNLGNALLDLQRPEEALAQYQQALQQLPDSPEYHLNLGNAYNDMDRPQAAETAYRRSLELDGTRGRAWTNLGNALEMQKRYAEAESAYQTAIKQAPESPDAHFNLAVHHLAHGEFKQGWAGYEWGLKGAMRLPHRDFPQPRWQGEKQADETLLIYAEQGNGDTLQFLRYLPLAKAAHGGRLVLECQQCLSPLLASCAGPDEIVERQNDGRIQPHFDRYVALMSLPHILGLGSDIPTPIPYLAPSEKASADTAWLADAPGLKIGIAWTGNPLNKQNRRRSCPLSAFAGIAALPGVQLYSLLFGKANAELAEVDFPVTELALPWNETAAAIQRLDLVISIDTAIAHLAGALGAPLWLLLPEPAEWRWQIGREDSPWYPQARLIRQTESGDWGLVFERLEAELVKLGYVEN